MKSRGVCNTRRGLRIFGLVTKIDRRGVIRVFAAGSACAAGGTLAGQASSAPSVGIVDPSAPVLLGWAEVEACRSNSGDVYLRFDATHRGFVAVDARGLAIAAACQAAGRSVAAQVWGLDPAAAGGAGRFEGALLAVQLHDLPGAGPASRT